MELQKEHQSNRMDNAVRRRQLEEQLRAAQEAIEAMDNNNNVADDAEDMFDGGAEGPSCCNSSGKVVKINKAMSRQDTALTAASSVAMDDSFTSEGGARDSFVVSLKQLDDDETTFAPNPNEGIITPPSTSPPAGQASNERKHQCYVNKLPCSNSRQVSENKPWQK